MIDIKEVLQKNVEGLTDEQLQKVGELFDNSIKTRIAEIHRSYDADIAELTGKTKPDGVKTYDWLKNEYNALKSSNADQVQKATADLQQQVNELQEKLDKAKSGSVSDVVIGEWERKLADANDLLEQHKNQYETSKFEFVKKLQEADLKNKSLEANQHLVGVSFRDDIPESLRKMAIDNALSYVTNLQSEVDAEGNRLYRDAEGKLMTNPENGLAPYTTKELLLNHLKDVVSEGRKAAGTGGKGGNPSGSRSGLLRITANTQAGAMAELVDQLHSQGIPQGDPRHQTMIDKAWTEYKVAEMPAQ